MSDIFSGGGDGGDGGGGFDWLQLALYAATQSNQPDAPIREGRRLTNLQLLTARPGHPITRVYGRMRIGGQIIWRSKVREHVSESGGDDGDKGGGGSATPRQRNYRYTLHLAVGLCEGPISHIGRVWADGKPLDTTQMNMHLHCGETDASADSLIEGAMGVDATPAFRGLAYVVLRDFDISRFGNRVPQMSFEVFRAVSEEVSPTKAVCLLPGASEFAYHPEPHIQVIGIGRGRSENLNTHAGQSDWDISIDQLQQAHPQCQRVALVVAWFGTDLRAAECRILPKVDNKSKHTLPTQWHVAGLNRGDAERVSEIDGRPSFGGTPSDGAVVAAIRDLHARGFEVLFYPFIMMDIAPDNELPQPHNGAQGQPAFPWRGRITRDASDQSASAREQVRRFVEGRSSNDAFCLAGMVRHYAELCARAGGVEAFLIASELPGLSRMHDGGDYPFAGYLRTLAAEVRAKLPDSKISYAADWSEYGAHAMPDGDVGFPLDAFWADDNCDFIGIDNYLPLADWRDGPDHLDAQPSKDGSISGLDIYDADYLQANVRGGEYFDWYYKTAADRATQTRTPITDGHDEAWVFRAKDLHGWWANAHHTRRQHQRGAATSWTPKMKPIWFTELGCPAVDKGANQPNVFPDTRSSEGAIPHFSNGARDDQMQSAYLAAMIDFYEKPENNPQAQTYGASMVAIDQSYIWAWDARPFPSFPFRLDVWSDGRNWHTGHWLNGRYASAPLTPLLRSLAGGNLLTHDISGVVDGYALRGVTTAADDMLPLLRAFAIDAMAGQSHMRLQGRANRPVRAIDDDDILARANGASSLVHGVTAADKLPRRFDVHYLDAEGDYGAAHVSARHEAGEQPVAQLNLPVAMSGAMAARLAARLLYEARGQSETISLRLPPSYLDMEIGDIIRLTEVLWRVTEITYGTVLEVQAQRFQSGLYGAYASASGSASLPETVGQVAFPAMYWLDLPAPALRYQAPAGAAGVPMLAAFAAPWPSRVAVRFGDGQQLYVNAPSQIGKTLSRLDSGAVGRWSRGAHLDIELYGGALASMSEIQILNGANRLAIETAAGWEIIQFARAELIGERRYRISDFLRGQFGSDAVMVDSLAKDARVVVLSGAQTPLGADPAALSSQMSLRYGPSDLPHDGYSWQNLVVTPQRIGLRCLSPVHLGCTKPDGVSGAWRLDWIRRSRLGGDDFEALEIPLGETSEAYQLIIRADTTEVARHRLTESHFSLTAQARRDYLAAEPDAQRWHIEVAQFNSIGMAGVATHLDLPHFMEG